MVAGSFGAIPWAKEIEITHSFELVLATLFPPNCKLIRRGVP